VALVEKVVVPLKNCDVIQKDNGATQNGNGATQKDSGAT